MGSTSYRISDPLGRAIKDARNVADQKAIETGIKVMAQGNIGIGETLKPIQYTRY